MPETPEEFYARTKDALRMPPVEEWETFPFDGEIRPRTLLPPAADEKPRRGAGGVDCYACSKPADDLIWEDEHWQLTAIGPTGLPLVLILEPKEHYDIETLPADLATELGPLLQRIELAVRSAGDIGRVHIARWGEGSEHLHWWFMGRPARMRQLSDSFAAIWDDILPPVPEDAVASRPRSGRRSARRMTYSIVARDPKTGELGVAVQSRAFNTGAIVPGRRPAWASWRRSRTPSRRTGRSGSTCCGPGRRPRKHSPSSSPRTTEREYRQVAILDGKGGSPCMSARPASRQQALPRAKGSARRRTWSTVSASGSRWRSPSSAPKDRSPIALLDALDAAEAAGGDWRGRQAGGIIVVAAEGEPWAREVDVRVDDHDDPLGEIAPAGSSGPGVQRHARAARARRGGSRGAARARPTLARIFGLRRPVGSTGARGLLRPLLEAEPRWADFVRTLADRGLLPNAAELLED